MDYDSIKPMSFEPLPPYPLVSVLLNNLNSGKFIGKAIESVRGQTYTNFEVIVCDAGSTDASIAVVNSISQKDARVTLISKCGGQPSGWNAAFQRARGCIICFLDSDDCFSQTKLETVVRALASGDIGAFMNRSQFIDSRGNALPVFSPHQQMDEGWLIERAFQRAGYGIGFPSASGMSFRKSALDKIFPIPENRYIWPDGYLVSTIQFLVKIGAIDQVLSYCRIHDGNVGGKKNSLANTWSLVERDLNVYCDTVSAANEFLARTFGDRLEKKLDPENWQGYWEHVAALYVFSGKPGGRTAGYTKQTILAKLGLGRIRRLIWDCLFALPLPISRRLLAFWWGNSALKQLIKQCGVGLSYEMRFG